MPTSFTGGDHTPENTDPQGQGNPSFTEPTAQDPAPQTLKEENSPQISQEELAAILKRDQHAQDHIKTLEADNAAFREKLEALSERLEQSVTAEDLLRHQGKTEVDLEDLSSKVFDKVSEQSKAIQAKEREESNFKSVADALSNTLGDKADDHVSKVAADNDMTFDDMVAMARKNPKLALKLLNVETKPTPQPSGGSYNTQGLGQQAQESYKPVNVMELRTDRARVDDFYRRMEEGLKKYK